MKRETVCSQVLHCLSCPLSPLRTGKDCRKLTAEELAEALAAAGREAVATATPPLSRLASTVAPGSASRPVRLTSTLAVALL